MSQICIGGCCIPYTAIVPFFILMCKWFVEKLANMGLLPEGITKWAGVSSTTTSTKTCCGSSNKSTCIDGDDDVVVVDESLAKVSHVSSVEEWESLILHRGGDGEESESEDTTTSNYVVVKFTADWCQPCKRIEPYYKYLSAKYASSTASSGASSSSSGKAGGGGAGAGVVFVKIDVDELDEVAQQYDIAMMPTFAVLRRRTNGDDGKKKKKKMDIVGKYSGSHEESLDQFLKEHILIDHGSSSTNKKRV